MAKTPEPVDDPWSMSKGIKSTDDAIRIVNVIAFTIYTVAGLYIAHLAWKLYIILK